ncbi:multiple sugar transport system permease protein [Catenuloplanes nepalensis]|uniref:Multiple sugar transport system permease protein n=1 Tax=Catenuloplanes nepalensis TaxID=587533 RepID=A0ABT9MYU9_9ACTN|nr:carbohydrate ABC transporter permease [Catenuloplanes nepalensis]MDP9796629.1 multiple sugar transport system permease protein [Catenuloplanes nepalensis]
MGARRWPIWTGLAVAAVVFTYPFAWLVSASLKPRPDVFDNALIPREWAPENYVTIWSAAPVLTWLGNSVVVALAAAATVTVSSAIVAFGFAYFRFPGRNALFALVVGTMMLPGAVTMIPTYLIWNELGLAATQVPLWAQNLFGSAFYIFLIRQFFLGVPRELFEAARVDGASYWRLFWRIAVPLCRPALIVAFVFELRASWSDLLRPLIYLRDPALFTMPRGMKAILDQFGQAGEARWEVVLAGAVLTTVPMIIAFLLCQRYFIEGVATQGRKG